MPEFKSPGQLAYEGFSQKSGGKSVITSEPLPVWNAQIEAVKQSWEAAAAAVNTAQNVEPPKPAPEPVKKPVERPVEKPEPDQFASYRAATQAPTAPKPQPITQTLPKPVERPEPPKGPVSQPPLKPKTF